ncbi:MAG: dTDP-4-dehydrorhamnose 3,5-epimerase family protein [Patescibacteria group bacterium]|nr:dTDP-4-dehydrorhamnose 3,5-epimerase family protein [Patescibacteria group bacterium]
MIQGVKIKQLKLHHDDRGFLTELMRLGEEAFFEIKQTIYTETHPGVIKAFHWHKKQWDGWFVIKGMGQVVLYDLREDSPTFKQTQVIFAGEKNPVLICIPPRVAHGYRVIGNEKFGLLYHTSETHDKENPDEERIDWNDPSIGFDWTTKNR